MASDDSPGDRDERTEVGGSSPFPDNELDRTRERLEEGAERAVDEFDQGIVDLLAWLLDTETRARIYVYLRRNPEAISQEIADGTGLYPSTVREALSELHEEGAVTREKRESEGAGNNPYAYRAIPPSELVSGAIGDIQSQLNTVFTLDDRLRGETEPEGGPVTISVGTEGAGTEAEKGSNPGFEEKSGADESHSDDGVDGSADDGRSS